MLSPTKRTWGERISPLMFSSFSPFSLGCLPLGNWGRGPDPAGLGPLGLKAPLGLKGVAIN